MTDELRSKNFAGRILQIGIAEQDALNSSVMSHH